MAQIDVHLKEEAGIEFFIAEAEKVTCILILKNICSMCVLKQLCMWVVFDDSYDRLKKMEMDEQNVIHTV